MQKTPLDNFQIKTSEKKSLFKFMISNRANNQGSSVAF